MKTSKVKRGLEAVARTGAVFCRRLDRKLAEQEHLACPYCYGRALDVQSTDHARFCDYEKGKDAVVFGFPDTHGRHHRE